MAPGQGMGSVPGDPRLVTTRRRRRPLAVGGERQVPVPDPIARDYLLLGLRLDQHIPGSRRRLLRPGRPEGARSTSSSSGRRPRSPTTPTRSARACSSRGRRSPIAATGWPPSSSPSRPRPASWPARTCRTSSSRALLRLAAGPPRRGRLRGGRGDAIDALLPGPEPLADRLAGLGRRGSSSRRTGSRAVLDWLVASFRERAGGLVRASRTARTSGSGYVRNQPWSGYNWYDGGLRSRFDVNTRPADPGAAT